MRPERVRYSVTTMEPGASEVFTHDGTFRPFSTAFFATSPAATSTYGFEVLVQLVMAAITTLPWLSALSSTTCSSATSCCESMPAGCPPSPSQRDTCFGGTCWPGLSSVGNACSNDLAAADSGTRSCGRLGPAMLGSTVARSNSSTCVYSASGVLAV